MLNPLADFVGTTAGVKFNGEKQEKIILNHWKIVKIYTVHKMERNVNISSYPAQENYLCGAVKLTKHLCWSVQIFRIWYRIW